MDTNRDAIYDLNNYKESEFKSIDKYHNCFERIKSVKTDLLYGNTNNINTPMLSVIIPTYNRKEYLKAALESILIQEHVEFEWEVIVIDNSEPKPNGYFTALDIVKQIDDKRVLYYHNEENIGSGYNWNRGVELARGEWVCFLHDDDLACKDALKNIQRIIKKYANKRKPLGYIHANRVELSPGQDIESLKILSKNHCMELTRVGALLKGQTQTGMPTCCTTIKKEAYMKAGGINYDYGPTADAILGYQIMKKYRVIQSDRILGVYRWGTNETLNKNTAITLIQTDRLLAEYCYGLNLFSKIFGFLFADVQMYRNIRNKIKYSNKGNNQLEYDDIKSFSKKPLYTLRQTIYLGIRIVYKLIYTAKGLLCN